MNVYVLMRDMDDSRWDIVSIHSTRALAEAALRAMADSWSNHSVDEWPVDEAAPEMPGLDALMEQTK